MKDKKGDGASLLIPSDKEVNWAGARRRVSFFRKVWPRFWSCGSRAADLDSLQIGLVRAQQAKPMTARRKTGIMRVVHRLAALWLLASDLGNSLDSAAAEGEEAMVAPRRATVAVDRRCRWTSGRPIRGWSGDNNKTTDVWRAPRQILRAVRALMPLPCIGDPCSLPRG